MTDSNNKIKEYWNNRAQEHVTDLQGTTNDTYLRELEINTIANKIRDANLAKGSSIVDIGCGDGYSTMRLANLFPDFLFTGVDYAESMIVNANSRLVDDDSAKERVEFKVADILDLEKTLHDQKFDIAITMRVLINLPDFSLQKRAIGGIASRLVGNGRYIAVENFTDGQQNMNELRSNIGLPEIPVRWHNLFFDKTEFINSANEYFKQVNIIDFASSYYYITRVIYSKMCQVDGVEPSYDHSLYRVALEIPPQGEFSPIKIIIMEK